MVIALVIAVGFGVLATVIGGLALLALLRLRSTVDSDRTTLQGAVQQLSVRVGDVAKAIDGYGEQLSAIGAECAKLAPVTASDMPDSSRPLDGVEAEPASAPRSLREAETTENIRVMTFDENGHPYPTPKGVSRDALLAAVGLGSIADSSPAQSVIAQVQAEMLAIGGITDPDDPGNVELSANLGALLTGFARRLEVAIELSDAAQDRRAGRRRE